MHHATLEAAALRAAWGPATAAIQRGHATGEVRPKDLNSLLALCWPKDMSQECFMGSAAGRPAASQQHPSNAKQHRPSVQKFWWGTDLKEQGNPVGKAVDVDARLDVPPAHADSCLHHKCVPIQHSRLTYTRAMGRHCRQCHSDLQGISS